MAIRIKYDPVGPLFLGAYASGAAQGKDRRRRELMAMAQKAQETAAAQRERALDRFERNNVFVPDAAGGVAPAVPGAPALPAPGAPALPAPAAPAMPADSAAAAAAGGAAALKTWRDTHPAEWEALPDIDKIKIARGALSARGMPTPGAAPGLGGSYVPRDVYEQQQRDEAIRRQQEEADLAFRRRSLPDMPVPDGVQANPKAAREYGELQGQLKDIKGGRKYDPTNPDSAAKVKEIEDRMLEIESVNPAPKAADVAAKNTFYKDSKGSTVDAEGKPYTSMPEGGSEWYFDPRSSSGPVRTDAGMEKEKAEKEKIEKDKAKLDADYKTERDEAYDAMKEDVARISTSDEYIGKPKDGPESRAQAIADRRKEFNDKWPVSRPIASESPLPGLGGPGYTPPTTTGAAPAPAGAPPATPSSPPEARVTDGPVNSATMAEDYFRNKSVVSDGDTFNTPDGRVWTASINEYGGIRIIGAYPQASAPTATPATPLGSESPLKGTPGTNKLSPEMIDTWAATSPTLKAQGEKAKQILAKPFAEWSEEDKKLMWNIYRERTMAGIPSGA